MAASVAGLPNWSGPVVHGPPVFKPQPANVSNTKNNTYPENHLLGLPRELRMNVLERVDEDIKGRAVEVLGDQPRHDYQNLPLVNKQMYHEVLEWATPTRLVTHHQLEKFMAYCINNAHTLQKLTSLSLEVPHNSPGYFFMVLAKIIKCLPQLEELKIYCIGPDKYGVETSSVAHLCGKHDINFTLGPVRKLTPEGQNFEFKLLVLKAIPFLANLKTLVLDNFNCPMLRAHVLKNKPRLEHLYIGCDPRSTIHHLYFNSEDTYGVQWLTNSVLGVAPPMKELHVCMNGVLGPGDMVRQVAPTLEVFSMTVADSVHQITPTKLPFLPEASIILQTLATFSPKLRSLRVCVQGTVYDGHIGFGEFIFAFKDYVSRMKGLKVLELHIRSEYRFLAQEFIDAIPASVERLCVGDTFVRRDLKLLVSILEEKTKMTLHRVVESSISGTPEVSLGLQIVADDLSRHDSIPIIGNLGFVGYEFGVFPPTEAQIDDFNDFLRLNGKLLDKERNQHLAEFRGKSIPFKVMKHDKASVGSTKPYNEPMPDAVMSEDEAWLYELKIYPSEDVEDYLEEWEECGLVDDNKYFGREAFAEAIFLDEPVAPFRKPATYPHTVDVEDNFKQTTHWLSK